MSGIVGIVNTDGAPVDAALLSHMTEFMAPRGPDARNICVRGHVGLGHAMLHTTPESLRETQPCSLDGEVWITADARIDARVDLMRELEGKGRAGVPGATDAELILHSYLVWGEQCVEHLLGDFAFAIWDGRRQRLFCARDHFGVKPFYYARPGDSLVFSNTLRCIRLHPAVPNELNDLAVADFLLFGQNQEPGTTTFAGIWCLPAAHSLTVSARGMQCKPYWELPTDGQVRYKRSGDYVEQFRELLQTAVDDRIRGVGSVGLTMSGGLDSSAVAVAACRASARRDPGPAVRAFTAVYDHVVPDQERHYSGLVAAKLGIGVDYLSADAYLPFAHWQRSELAYPEPSHGPLPDIHLDLYRRLADHSRVVLTGHGADALLRPSQLAGLAGRVPTVSLLLNALQVGIHYRQLPNFGLRSKIRRRMGVVPGVPVLPGWLRPSFAARLDLAARWEQLHRPSPPRHRLRPDAYASLSGTFWPGYLSAFDPGVTMVPVESRFPFFDVRLVTFALAIPPVPWCVNKHLLREALRGHVPESVRQRPKSPVAGDAVAVLLREHAPSAEAFVATPELEQYVDIRAATKGSPIGDPAAWWTDLRPWSLNHWLRHRDQLAVPDRVGEVLALNPQGRCAGAKIRWEQ